ncbi:TetR/AcrR family transcriptional regulator [Tsukamurella sputi]|nr:TetR/AcrR family transcriptional regulator [Tsukamurella sputi]
MRERILAAAVTIVATQGFAACTVREVAEAVGIKAPGLYSHFPSKEAILSEAVSRVLADFMATAALVPASSPEQELKASVRQHVLYQLENQLLARVTDVIVNTASAGRVVSPEDYERILAGQHAHLDLVARRVSAYSPELPPDQVGVATRAIVSMCDGVAAWYRPDGPLDPEALADLHWRFVRRMLG